MEQAVKILTSAYGYANSKTQYPDGFMSAAQKYNLFDNVTSSRLGKDVKRIDVAVMLYNAAKINKATLKTHYDDQIHCNEFFR